MASIRTYSKFLDLRLSYRNNECFRQDDSRQCSIKFKDPQRHYWNTFNIHYVSGEGSQSDNEETGEQASDQEDKNEKEKTDQSQQTTPTTPPADTGRIVNIVILTEYDLYGFVVVREHFILYTTPNNKLLVFL